jgi:subtilase family serine protease
MPNQLGIRSWMSAGLVLAGCSALALAQASTHKVGRQIDERLAVTLEGNVHPLARAEFDRGLVSPDIRLEQMVLVLKTSASRQAELDAMVEAQHDPQSPFYHRWLTPAEYGARFGVSAQQMAQVTGWLAGHGFEVNEIPVSNRLIIFSGSAGQVADTFHTELHHYRVDGVTHMANAESPQIPAALTGVVEGIVSLHDFRRTPAMTRRRAVEGPAAVREQPQYSSGSTHYLFPADFAAIYNLKPLYSEGTSGAGTSIAIVGRSNINLSDVSAFRAESGLAANSPAVILVGADPGLVSGDQDESTLDVEWSGAVAPSATVKFVVGASTVTSDGVDLSAQYIVNHALAPVVSTSYGSCEQQMGAAELAFYNSLWEQAASQGMSSFVASGDSGAAGCSYGSSTSGAATAVNGLCSSTYSTCVGGTQFNEGSNSAAYWATANSTGYGSALGYIPEVVWNESGSSGGTGLWASGGGVSLVYAQPSWQQGVSGTSAANGMRAVPDVALSAAGHDGYIIYENGSSWVISGTSAAAPSFAALMALVVESQGGNAQGNANAGLYPLLNSTHNPFHNTPSGNNSVPGVAGFTASGAPYNLATGLGSVDGAVLVSSWGAGVRADFALTASATSGTIVAGNAATFTVSAAESGSAKNLITLTAQGPAGVTISVAPAYLVPGTTATVTVSVGASVPAGTQNITLTGSDASGTQRMTFALTVTLPPVLVLSANSSVVTVAQGASNTAGFSVSTGGSFSGNVSLSVSGLPAGMTAQWSANPLTPASSDSTNQATLTLTAANSAAVAATQLVITAAGDGLVSSQAVTLQVQQAPGIQLTVSPSALSVLSRSTATVTVTATPVGGIAVSASAPDSPASQFTGPPRGIRSPLRNTPVLGLTGASIRLLSGLPQGFTATWSAPAVNPSGTIAWTLTLTGSSTAASGSSTLNMAAQVTAAKTGATYTASLNVPITVMLTTPAFRGTKPLPLNEGTLRRGAVSTLQSARSLQ